MCYVNCTSGVDRQNPKDFAGDRDGRKYNITRPFGAYILLCLYRHTDPSTHVRSIVIPG